MEWSGYQRVGRARSPSAETPRGTVSERGRRVEPRRERTDRSWGGGGEAVEELVEGLVLNSDVWEAERRVGWMRRVGRGGEGRGGGCVETAPRCSAAAQRSDGHTDRAALRRPPAGLSHSCFSLASAVLRPKRTQHNFKS